MSNVRIIPTKRKFEIYEFSPKKFTKSCGPITRPKVNLIDLIHLYCYYSLNSECNDLIRVYSQVSFFAKLYNDNATNRSFDLKCPLNCSSCAQLHEQTVARIQLIISLFLFSSLPSIQPYISSFVAQSLIYNHSTDTIIHPILRRSRTSDNVSVLQNNDQLQPA